LDNAQININIPENAEIIAVESKMHHLWKSMIMMACNNYKEDHEEKELSFDYSVNAQFNNIIFKFNGPQIEKYILDKNLNIGNSDDQDDLNLNLRIIRKITEDISGSFEIDSAPDNNIFTVKIPHTPAKKSLILQQSLAHKKSPTRRL
jgi:nitrogen-specific signal transduction histidine kinase